MRTAGAATESVPSSFSYHPTEPFCPDWVGSRNELGHPPAPLLGPHGAGYQASPIVGAISNDYGHTWNRQGFPVSDAAHPYNQGSQVQFGPDGALYVAYEGGAPSTAYATDVQVLARSTDDGLRG